MGIDMPIFSRKKSLFVHSLTLAPMHTHSLRPEKHAALLAQDRRDPISGDFLKAGDEVVFCAGCRSAFLKDSWEYLGKTHCGQKETLQKAPAIHTGVKLKRVRKIEKAPPRPSSPDWLENAGNKAAIFLLDSLFFAVVYGAFLLLSQKLSLPDTLDWLVLFLLYLFWDIVCMKRSPAKLAGGIVITNADRTTSASVWRVLSRRVCTAALWFAPWLLADVGFAVIANTVTFLLSMIILFSEKYSLVSFLTKTRVIEGNEQRWNAYQARHKREAQL